LYFVTIVNLFSSVVYNKYADEPVCSVTVPVIFQIDKKCVCNLVSSFRNFILDLFLQAIISIALIVLDGPSTEDISIFKLIK